MLLLSAINLNKYLPLFDASENYQLGFQDPASTTMEGIINFHNYIMVFIVGVLIFVFYLLTICLKDYVNSEDNNGSSALPNTSDLVFTHSTELEVIWTLVPAFVLMIIAVPSFALLYSLEESVAPEMTLKVIGHQWFWSYEYPEMATAVEPLESEGTDVEKVLGGSSPIKLGFDKSEILGYDSYMLSENDLPNGLLRLLEVDKRVVLPVKTHIRVLVTAADVLHSWAVPSFGVKVDACPGRLNQASIYVKRTGVYFGQCSEICGVNHGFMPIAIKVISKKDFLLEMELSAWGNEEE
jgi:cytochrome c oxidase subunit 2